jgi:membrane protein implicated in regulation of membrane protease activity
VRLLRYVTGNAILGMAFAFLWTWALAGMHLDIGAWAIGLFFVTFPIGAVVSFLDARRRLKERGRSTPSP